MYGDDIVVYDSMMGSNLKAPQKSMIQSWFDKVTGGKATQIEKYRSNTGITKSHVISAVTAIRQTLESSSASFALGALHADVGLDIVGVPADLALGIAGTAASIALGNYEVSPDLLNIGTAGNNVYAFRKGYDWIAAKKKASGGAPAGQFGQESTIHGEEPDPVVRAAKTL